MSGFATFRVLEGHRLLILTDDTGATSGGAQTWFRLFSGTHHPEIFTPEGSLNVKLSDYKDAVGESGPAGAADL